MEPWTGRTACALQAALRLSNEAFAERLGIAARTVAGWRQKPTLKPKSEMQQLLDTALDQASPAAKERFHRLASAPPPQEDQGRDDPARRLDDDPHINAALDWIDQHTGAPPGTARRDVAALLPGIDLAELRDRSTRRGRIHQAAIASALAEYYGIAGLYQAQFGDLVHARTSVLTQQDWLDLRCPLTPAHDRLTVGSTDIQPSLTDFQADRAARRLAETLVSRTRLVDAPLYQLTGLDIDPGAIGGTLAVTRFAHYALTMDLLESELVDAISTGSTAMPLRDAYLPSRDAVLDVSGRLCAGGVLALSAFARPATPHRPADFLLIVQERSGHVLNAARRLAVIPKGFHQPLTDLRHDAQLGVSLRREMEEELFGREEIDCTLDTQNRADPMHSSHLSEPLRWLDSEPERLTLECTGFGLNLVSGNYEFAALILVNDDEFWPLHGGHVAANWETSGLRRYSSLDAPLLADLIRDPAWSNEGLFALLQGLRRLAEIDPSRVHLPHIAWHLG